MRQSFSNAMTGPARVARSGPARYTVLLVGLGAAGMALGWRGPEMAAVMKRR